MKTLAKAGLALWIITMASGSSVEGQFNPYVPRPPNDARMRRLMRERAVVYAGPRSRDFVECMGEDAVAAMFACSPYGAWRLAEFHNCGGLARLPRPHDLLRVIAQPNHGDDVALFAIANAPMLSEPEYFNVFLATPLEYALALKDLDAQVRARRQGAPPGGMAVGSLENLDSRWIVGAAGALGIVGLLIWWKRRR